MSKQHALVIEDDEDLSAIFGQALRSAGYEVELIRDGQLAVQRLAEATPAVIVLDLHLPNVAGPEVLEHIRADARLSDTRIIIASADARLAHDLTDQVDFVFLKPISFSQLRDLAERLRPAPPL